MRKLIKIAAALIVAGLMLVIAARVALHIFLPPEKAKALVLKEASSQLKREVRIGSVSVGVFSGLTLSNLAVSEAPTFAQGTFLSSDEFSLRVALVPLLFKKLVVRELVLRKPQITVVRYADGKTFNFSDLLVSTTTTAAAPVAAVPVSPSAVTAPENDADHSSLVLLVSRAEITDGIVHFVDRSPAKQSVDLDPIQLLVKNVSLTSPFVIQTSLTAKSRGTVLNLNLQGDVNLQNDSFSFKRCTLETGGSTISLTGRASKLRSGHPAADLHIAIGQFNVGTLAPWMTLPPGVQISGPLAGTASLKGDDKTMNFSTAIDFSKMDIHDGSAFSKPAKIPMSVSIEGTVNDMQNVAVRQLSIVLASLHAAGHGTVMGLQKKPQEISFHVETNTFAVGDLLQCVPGVLPKTITLGGATKASADLSGTLASNQISVKWQGKDLSIAVGDQFLKPIGVPLEVSLIGELTQPPTTPPTLALDLSNLSGVLGPMRLTGKAAYKTVGSSVHMAVDMKTNLWSVQEVAKLVPLLAAYKPSGQASLVVKAGGSPKAPIAGGSVVLQNVAAKYQASELSGLSSILAFTETSASTPKLSGKLNGSPFTIKFSGSHLTTQPTVALDATIADLDLDKLLPPTASTAHAQAPQWVSTVWAAEPTSGFASLPMNLSGHAVVGHIEEQNYRAKDLDVKWSLTNVTSTLDRVSGSATLRQGVGKLTNVQQLIQSSKFAKILLEPIAVLQKIDTSGTLTKMGLPSLQAIPFDSLKGDYTLQSGVMTVQTFELAGQDLALQTKGTVTLPEPQPLNLHVVSKLAAGSIGGTIGALTQDASGRPTLSFVITGTSAHPSVTLDLTEVKKRAAQVIGQQVLKALSGGSDNNNSDNNSKPDLQKVFKNIFH